VQLDRILCSQTPFCIPLSYVLHGMEYQFRFGSGNCAFRFESNCDFVKKCNWTEYCAVKTPLFCMGWNINFVLDLGIVPFLIRIRPIPHLPLSLNIVGNCGLEVYNKLVVLHYSSVWPCSRLVFFSVLFPGAIHRKPLRIIGSRLGRP
jgi:hypothetical protein